MNKSIATLGLFLALTAGAVAFPLSKSGETVTVTLHGVSKLDRESLAAEFDGSPDGLKFTFVIERQGVGSGGFGLQELKDFSIDGQSYSSLSPHFPEPKTTISNPSQLSTTEQDVDFTPYDDSRAKVMVTRIAGSQLPESGVYKVKVTFAWGGKPESFEFEFDHLN